MSKCYDMSGFSTEKKAPQDVLFTYNKANMLRQEKNPLIFFNCAALSQKPGSFIATDILQLNIFQLNPL